MGISQVDMGFVRMVRIRAATPSPDPAPQWPPPASSLPHLCLAVQLEGRCTVEQGARRLRLTPENWVLCDASVPSRIRPEGRFDQVALLVPRSQLGTEQDLQAALRQPRSGCAGVGSLVFQAVRALACEQDRLAVEEAASLSSLVVRLVRVALRPPQVRRHASATSLWEKQRRH